MTEISRALSQGVLVSITKYEASTFSLTPTYDPSISALRDSPAAITTAIKTLSPCTSALLGAYASALRLKTGPSQCDFYSNRTLQGGNYFTFFSNETFSSSNWTYLLICHSFFKQVAIKQMPVRGKYQGSLHTRLSHAFGDWASWHISAPMLLRDHPMDQSSSSLCSFTFAKYETKVV